LIVVTSGLRAIEAQGERTSLEKFW